jgi:hypothetical protein
MGACLDCIYHRIAEPPNPLAGVRLSSARAIELRTKWQKELSERALLEQERRESGLPLDFEPVAYAYCEHYSEEESGGKPLTTWVLCDVANPNDECNDFIASGDD